MTHRAPIAVVVPAHNTGAFIADAISSVRAQTVPVADIVVVDDGSTDDTERRARALGARVLQQPHRGAAAARNAGVCAVSEPWVAFLDADDVWHPAKVERQWAAIARHPGTEFVTCGLHWFREALQFPALAPSGEERCTVFPSAPGTFLANEMTFMPSAALIFRKALLAAGLFDDTLHHNEDFECFLRVLRRSPLAVVRQPLVGVRMRPDSASKDALAMSRSLVTVLDRVAASPERYPRGTAEAYALVLPAALLESGRLLLRQGRRQEARELLARAYRLQRSRRAGWYWLATWLGRRIST